MRSHVLDESIDTELKQGKIVRQIKRHERMKDETRSHYS